MPKKSQKVSEVKTSDDRYSDVLASVVDLVESARRASARAVNCIMTATYWEVGRRIVELEQGGEDRAGYGEEILERLASDLTVRFGRGFASRNLYRMRRFYVAYAEILPTVLAKSDSENKQISPTVSAKLQTLPGTDLTTIREIAKAFPLPWSHYDRLLSLNDESTRRFYEEEALRGGWSVRQLNRQINSQFYERTLLSKNKAAMLRKGAEPTDDDLVTPEEEIKDPLVLEFLDLKDEYSESDLEEALIHNLEEFLLELGSDFTFVGRQRRLRIGRKWYRLDLLFFHRRLRCLVVIDLKIGELDHADVGQMHMYLNYAAEHWTNEDENPPVGLILCAQNDQAVAQYALDGLPNQVMAAEYKLVLPDEAALIAELEKTQRQFARAHKVQETSPKPRAKKTAATSREKIATKQKKKKLKGSKVKKS